MEWNFKKQSAWGDVSNIELQHSDNHQQLTSLAGHSSSGMIINNMFSVDLKLGGLGDHLGDLSVDTLKSSRFLPMAASQTVIELPKRSRVSRTGGAQTNVSCMVDGCTSDLSQGREYHRRHRVCERHSKTPVVVIGGREQRFCQQCSRFQSLGEFDEAKRSCRKRLDGHNRRRRKTRTEAYYMTSVSTQSNQTGDGLLQFWSSPRHTPDRPMISDPAKAAPYNQLQLTGLTNPVSQNASSKGHKQRQLLPSIFQQTVDQSLLNGAALIENNSRDVVKELPEDPDIITQSAYSQCALSLLSQRVAITSLAHGVGSSLHLNNSLAQFSTPQGLQDQSSASLCNASNNIPFGLSTKRHEGFSKNESSRIFPFGWE